MTQINEAITNADIGTADFSFNKVVKAYSELHTPSLVRQVAAIVPMKYSTGVVVNLVRDGVNNGFKTVQSTLTVNNISGNPTQSGISMEVIQDLQSQYGENATNIVAEMLRGVTAQEEDAAFATFLSTNATSTAALATSAPTNAESNMFEITQRVQELVLDINTPNFKTYEAFCILPYKFAAAISATVKYAADEEGAVDKYKSLGRIGSTHYYANSDTSATTAYVGLMSNRKSHVGASSIILGEYQQEIVMSDFKESFQPNIGIVNRYATALNPMSGVNDNMLVSFAIS